MRKKLRTATVVLVLLSAGIISWAKRENLRNIFVSPDEVIGPDNRKDDKILLAELERLMKPFMEISSGYHSRGTMTALDGADSAQAFFNRPFETIVTEGEFYHRFGNTETLSGKEISLHVDHDGKQMVIGPPQQLTAGNSDIFPDARTVFKDEGYKIDKTTENGIVEIRLLNEMHISCKEYRFSFDTASHMLRKIYTRYAEVSDPLNASLQKWVELNIEKWEPVGEAGSGARIKTYVTNKDGNWIVKPEWHSYRLIEN